MRDVMRVLVVAVVPLLGTCAAELVEDGAGNDARSGARLRARYLISDDGVRAFQGWHDRELGEDCLFLRAADETYRCFPAMAAARFTDEACTDLVGAAASFGALSRPKPRFIASSSHSNCDDPLLPSVTIGAVWEVAGPSAGNAPYMRYEGACVAEPNGGGTAEYFLPGAPVPMSRFVAAERVIEDGSTRLRDVVLLAEDGAREVVGIHDAALGVDCSLREDGSMVRCLPVAPRWHELFVDLGCATPAVGRSKGCPPPRYGLSWERGICTRTQVHEVLEPAPATWHHTDQAGLCSAIHPEGSEDAFLLGPALADDRIAAFRIVERGGAGRLRARDYVTEDGFSRPTGTYLDSARGEVCRIRLASLGPGRCMPESGSTISVNNDPSCSDEEQHMRQVAYEYDSATACLPRPHATVLYAWRHEGLVGDVRAVGTEIPASSVYVVQLVNNTMKTCVPPDRLRLPIKVFELGEVVPIDAFVVFSPALE